MDHVANDRHIFTRDDRDRSGYLNNLSGRGSRRDD
jgi:hypothetical protein